MSSKLIEFELSEKSIDKAIKELEDYKKDLKAKCDEMSKRVAEFFQTRAQSGFDNAASDTILFRDGTNWEVPAVVSVTVEPSENGVYMIVAHGEDAVWAEFGAGVYFNGPVGSSPNPLGLQNGFTIGSFGERGERLAWGTPDGNISRGTPASMPMANAMFAAEEELMHIAREVFG